MARLVIGQHGTGKSTAMKQWFFDDSRKKVFISFDGDVSDLLTSDVTFLDTSDREFPFGFNLFDKVPVDDRPYVALSVVNLLKSITGYTANTPVLDRMLYNSARLALDNNASLVGMFYILTKPDYRHKLLKRCTDPTIHDFWVEFDSLPLKDQRDLTASTLSNLEPFITDSLVRNIIGQTTTTFTWTDTVVISLPVKILGVQKAKLLGLLLLTALAKQDHYIYVDDAQFVVSPILSDIDGTFSIGQLSHLKDIPLLDIIEEFVSFRTGVDDSKKLKKIFGLGDQAIQTHELDLYTCLFHKGMETWREDIQPFENDSHPEKVINRCRNDFGSSRLPVENKITRFIRRLS